MKSRMAITSMLIAGILASGTGTGLAVSGISSDGSAGTAQYENEKPGKPKGPDVLGQEEGDGNGAPGDGTDVAGAQESRGGQGGSGVQATRQVGAQEDAALPFTGLAAIPLILMGIGLLATGAVLRRRLPQES